MNPKIEHLIDQTFKIENVEGQNKVLDLSEAVKRYIKPRLKLHISSSYYYPAGIINEVTRQFLGKKPEFTLISKGINLNTINLLAGGLISKAITAFHGDFYPVPRPNPIIIRAYLEKEVEFEDWSLYSFTQRLMAGALGMEFIPTNSIVGSDMAKENQNEFRLIDDPFGGGNKSGVLKSLVPDISLLHAWAVDTCGNTIILPPYGTLPWGAMASKQGVLVTAEKIVSNDFIRKFSHFVVIPGHFVRSVSLVPFGAHPQGMNNLGINEFDAYEHDYDFINEFQGIVDKPKEYQRWLKKWIINCNTQEEYLQKLGSKKIIFLKGKANSDSWIHELRSLEKQISLKAKHNSLELMTITAARKLKEKVIQKGFDVIFSGIGNSNLAAWLAYYFLKEEKLSVSLAAEIGFLGYEPRPVDPFIFSFNNLPTSKMLTDIVNILGIFAGVRNKRCLASLGAGQIDKFGNINSTKIPEKVYLTGSGGSNDVASTATEIVITAEQSRDRFVERVPYITCPGDKVTMLVSDMGIFEKLRNDKEFTLTHYLPDQRGSNFLELVEKIRVNCGWDLKVSENMRKVTPPTKKELYILRLFDPKGYFIGI